MVVATIWNSQNHSQSWCLLNKGIYISIVGPMMFLTYLAKVREVDPCVSTYINANKGFGGDKGPRDLFSFQKKLNSSLSTIDQSLRFQQRAVSYASFLLASLSKGLKGGVEVSDKSVSQLLGA